MNLVRISQAKEAGLPFAPATLYKMKHCRRFPDLFVKIGGAVFVDMDAFRELVEMSRLSRAGRRLPIR